MASESHAIDERRAPSITSMLRCSGRRIAKRLPHVLGLIILGVLVVFALFPTWISPYDPIEMDVRSRLQTPSGEHYFGTDEFGRDIFSRVVHGSRNSLTTALLAVLVSISIGVPIGLIAGYFGGMLDEILSRSTDIMLAFPSIILAMAMIAIVGRSSVMVAVVIGTVSSPAFFRITRATTLKVRGLPFVDAVRSAGASDVYIMFSTVLPNCSSQIYVQALLVASQAVIIEAGLSFLGLGVPPPTPSWGAMLKTGRDYIHQMAWYGVFPGLFIAALILSLQLTSGIVRQDVRS